MRSRCLARDLHESRLHRHFWTFCERVQGNVMISHWGLDVTLKGESHGGDE